MAVSSYNSGVEHFKCLPSLDCDLERHNISESIEDICSNGATTRTFVDSMEGANQIIVLQYFSGELSPT